MSEAAPDLDQVMADIDAEVKRRRASGDLPPSLERELDLVFERFAPVGALDTSFADAVGSAERAAFVNVAVPTASRQPLVGLLKRVLRKLMAWYLNYLAQQMTALGTSVVRALRVLESRVAELEERTEALRATTDDGLDRPVVAQNLSQWHQLVVSTLSGVNGRVLHTECGDGALLGALTSAGIDAYGVDPRGRMVDAAVANGADAWADDPIAHLDAVGDATLAGLVLSGCVDRLALGRQRRLVSLAATKLAPGGALVLLGTSPEAWANSVAPVEADLAPGRPLHVDTWRLFAEQARLSSVEVHEGRADTSIPQVATEVPGSAALNALIDRLNKTAAASGGFAVVGVRSA
jgi:SAM-dependent methyltransferase